MTFSLDVTPDIIGIGETISIQFKSTKKQQWDKLEVQFWGVIHQKLRLWPKPEKAIYLSQITENKYALETELPEQPFFAFGIVKYQGPCLIKILAHQNAETVSLAEKQVYIGESNRVCSSDFLQLTPKPVRLFFEGEAFVHSQTANPGCRIISNNEASKSIWSHFIPKLTITDQIQSNIQIHIEQIAVLPESMKNIPNPGEYYTLKTSIDATTKQLIVHIKALTETGIKHAFRTLNQIIICFDEQVEIPLLEIFDYPQFNNRGVIEGFYGGPWSQVERMDMIRFLGSVKCNSYIYAPKDDPYHRDKWDCPYPESEFLDLIDLIAVSKTEAIDFVYSISPGKSICYSDDAHLEKLIEKLDTIALHGVTSFAILLDDIDEIGFAQEKDQNKFNNNFGLAHCYLVNRLYKALLSKYPKLQFIYCPTEYYQNSDSPYRQTIAEELHPDIKVFWTGDGVFSKPIKKEFAQEIKTFFNHPLVLWDNYPVNDANANCIFLGPVINRDPELSQLSPDFYSNPMIEANLSKFTLTTVADYTWNPRGYDPEQSYLKSIELLAGDNSESVKVFADTTFSSRIFKGGNWELNFLIQSWMQADSHFTDHTTNLARYLKVQKQHADKLLNSTFLSRFRQLEPYLNEWKTELQICILCLGRFDLSKNQLLFNELDQVQFDKFIQSIHPMLITVCGGRLLKLIEFFKQHQMEA
jgi:hyaluronoglucosaminidase